MSDGSLHAGHRSRLRARFREEGAEHFEDHQLLELLLFYALPRIDTNELAHRLIDTFGSLAGVFDADISALTAVPGVGESAAILIRMIPALSRSYLTNRNTRFPTFSCEEDIGAYLVNRYIGETAEKPIALLYNAKKEFAGSISLGTGSDISSTVSVRKIVAESLNRDAPFCYLAHNHPFGNPVASDDDIITTNVIAKTLENLSIHLLGHFIVANGRFIQLYAEDPHGPLI